MTLPKNGTVYDLAIPSPDLEAERALLSSVLSDPADFHSVVSMVSNEDFVEVAHGLLWATIRRLHGDGVVPEAPAVILRLREISMLDRVGATRLAELATAAVSGANKVHYAAQVRKQAFSRAVTRVSGHTQERIVDGMPPEEALDLQRQEVEGLTAAYAATNDGSALAPPPKFCWRSIEQIREAAEAAPREFLWAGFVATGSVAVIAGEPKAGKSEIMAAFIAAVTRGWAWLGIARPIAKVVLVSEEGDHDLVEKLQKYGVDEANILVLSRDADMLGGSWVELILEAVRQAALFGATLLVIDTLSFWAGLAGDEERNENVMRERLQALQPARKAGLATLLSHHTVKSAEVSGISALRGSSAFAANAEAIGIYRKYGSGDTSVRSLESHTRWANTGKLVVDRVQPEGERPTFAPVNRREDAEKSSAETDQKIIASLKKTGAWLTKPALMEASGLTRYALDPRLPELAERGVIQRMGTGAKGCPFKYAARGIPVVGHPGGEMPAEAPSA